MAKGCKWAERTDEYHGWKCPVTDGACMFFVQIAKRVQRNTEKVRIQ